LSQDAGGVQPALAQGEHFEHECLGERVVFDRAQRALGPAASADTLRCLIATYPLGRLGGPEMVKTSVAFLLAGMIAASLPDAASAVPITYLVNRGFGPSEEGTVFVFGTLTVDDAGPTVTDWNLTLTSQPEGSDPERSVTLDPSNSDFLSISTTLTPTPTELEVNVGIGGIFGVELRDDATTLRHEWLLREDLGFIEQIFVDFADPDPFRDSGVTALNNPATFFAAPVPEPGGPLQRVAGLAVLAAIGRRSRWGAPR
jgi:hypothetical protein